MGMYTELFLSCEFNEDLPKEAEKVLLHLFDAKDEPESLPDHEFFSCTRWRQIGSMCSFYFTPFALSKIEKEQGSYYLTTRSDLKNYDSEIEKFLNWVEPYIYAHDGDHLGHYRYEEDDKPTLIFKAEYL